MQLEDIGSDHLWVKIEMEFEPAYNEICTKKTMENYQGKT